MRRRGIRISLAFFFVYNYPIAFCLDIRKAQFGLSYYSLASNIVDFSRYFLFFLIFNFQMLHSTFSNVGNCSLMALAMKIHY